MPLQSGTDLGPYRILGPLGAGGMGEVYRARDSKLGRDVALKVLPEGFVQDRDRLTRFRREAQMLGALNHPNIASIYGLEESGHSLALVLEFIDGETLQERINRGKPPIHEVLQIALQIAEALEAAHEKSIIHRDLKPANIKITSQGTVKVLDFGLAKAMQDELVADSHLSQSPTMSAGATGAGIILGTAAYMAPEQARGRPVDQRADIWSFGVLLFEMLSSRQAFGGETVTDILARILEREPEWKELPPSTPVVLRRLTQRCLMKNPKDRLQAIGDARTTLQELIQNPESLEEVSEAAPYPRWKKLLPWAVAPLFLAAGFLVKPSAPADRQVYQFEQPLPPNHWLSHGNRNGVELSPDGRQLAYIANSIGGPGAGRRIYVRSLDQRDAVALAGTEDAFGLFFSPDGQWIGFQQGQQIKKIPVGGGVSTVLVEKLNLQGAEWGPPGITWGDGSIVFPRALGEALSIVADSGGEPKEFTTLETEAHESSHRLPHFLPDGRGVLFTVLRYATVTPDWKRAQVWVKPSKEGERKLLLEDAMDARYVNNSLIFARQGKLYAVGFDLASLTVTGTPVQVLDGVTHALFGVAAITWSGAAQYSVSSNGTLVYAPGSIEPPLLSSLVWVDRTGKATPVEGMKPMFRFAGRVSPDGKKIASSELYVNKDIWIYDPSRGIEDRTTYEGQNAFPIWSPDGSRMAFRSDRASPLRIYLSSALGSRDVTELTPGPFDVPSSWSADGKELVFTRGFSAMGGTTDIYSVSTDKPNTIRPIMATPADERFPEISPDGKWLAFVSNESGRPELYVQPYPGPGNRVTVTSDGAQEVAWSRNSSELFYRFGLRMMAVRYKVTGTDFVPEKPVLLFERNSLGGGTTVRATFDVSPDGRFLMNQPVADLGERDRKIFPSTLRVILNWTEETKRLLAGSR